MSKNIHVGHGAWVGLAGYIIAYDWWALTRKPARPTLSETFHSLSRSKLGPFWVALDAYIALHLIRYLPEAADVLRKGGVRVSKNGQEAT